MDEETKKIQPEIENLNLDEIDVEELEKRLELAASPVLVLELAASPVNDLAVAGNDLAAVAGNDLAAVAGNDLAVAGGEIRITPGEIYIRWN